MPISVNGASSVHPSTTPSSNLTGFTAAPFALFPTCTGLYQKNNEGGLSRFLCGDHRDPISVFNILPCSSESLPVLLLCPNLIWSPDELPQHHRTFLDLVLVHVFCWKSRLMLKQLDPQRATISREGYEQSRTWSKYIE